MRAVSQCFCVPDSSMNQDCSHGDKEKFSAAEVSAKVSMLTSVLSVLQYHYVPLEAAVH